MANCLTLYFSGTGNTKYIANLFSKHMGAKTLSIESDADFANEIKSHDTIAFCYPIYGSRVPRIMREFATKYMDDIKGKKIVILVTQWLFSGDGARVFTDLFKDHPCDVIYAEHFNMPQNICNTPFLKPVSKRKMQKFKRAARFKMARVSKQIKRGIVKKHGFSKLSAWAGSIQGNPWQGLEQKVKNGVKIWDECTACNLCVKICPMKNLKNKEGKIHQLNNCTVCYRCVNRCPEKAITVLFHRRPKWQYKLR
ncbi:MAG: EFR1 family ferrodoxin [Defluviitaleaceae bacterium]|nr:EFR1 family ferrodoxin [Defluviitaleaceae bacterium]